MTDTTELPPLPEPAFRLRWSGAQGRYTVSKPSIDSQDCYSAEAMRAYAAEAVRVALEKADALTYCGCGDQFTADEPGTCSICRRIKGRT